MQANKGFGTNCGTPLFANNTSSIKLNFLQCQNNLTDPVVFFRGQNKCLSCQKGGRMICVGLSRGSRGVLLEAYNSVKNCSLGARRGLCAYVRKPIRVEAGGLNGRVGLPARTVRGLFSKPPTGTQGLPKDVKQQNGTTLVSIARVNIVQMFPLICL